VILEHESAGGSRLFEIIAVLLLGITTVGTAWCGYQSSQWNGRQSDLAREASDQRVEASRLFGVATQRVTYDANILGNYAEAQQSGNTRLAKLYRTDLARRDFLPVLDRWESQLRAGKDPTNLLDDAAYLQAQFGEYQKASAHAEALSLASQKAGTTASAYVITTILLAVALFFAGITPSFRQNPARAMLLVLALGTLAFAATRLSDLPIA
jgi:hypothetical protein